MGTREHHGSSTSGLRDPDRYRRAPSLSFFFLREIDAQALLPLFSGSTRAALVTPRVAAICACFPFKALNRRRPRRRRWFLLLCSSLCYDWMWLIGENETGMGFWFGMNGDCRTMSGLRMYLTLVICLYVLFAGWNGGDMNLRWWFYKCGGKVVITGRIGVCVYLAAFGKWRRHG